MSKHAMKLTIELVPKTSWYSNLRNNLSQLGWDRLRKMTYKNAEYSCQVCGGKGAEWPVECHEIWHYDDVSKIQKLVGLIALCPMCHKVKHIGHAMVQGEAKEALEHFIKVNGVDKRKANIYINECFDIYNERSLYDWKLDLSWLDEVAENE